jgi:glycine cleavage system H protein
MILNDFCNAKIIEYHDEKLWFQKKSNILTLGITVSSVDEIGDIEEVRLPSDGDDFDKDDIVCEIVGSAGRIQLYTPAAGFVIAVNSVLESDPAILAEDPIDEGWIVQIEIQDDTDLKEYL